MQSFRHQWQQRKSTSCNFAKRLFAVLCSQVIMLTITGSLLSVSAIAMATDTDGDGVHDSVDIDDDSDGILDIIEGAFPSAANALTPDGIEDTSHFPLGFWAASFYEGHLGVSGWNSGAAQNGNGGAGPAIYRGEQYVGFGTNFQTVAANGSAANGDWTQSETPTDPTALTGYAGTSWTSGGNPHYEINYRRTMAQNGTLTIGGNAGDHIDDVLIITVNGVDQYAAGPGGGFTDPVISATYSVSVNVNVGDEVQVRFVNIGGVGGFSFTLATPDETGGIDTDGDGINDHLDLDSDNDGISDLYESGTSNTNLAADADGNGWVSFAETNALLGAGLCDIDGDGLMDIFDADTASTAEADSIGTVPVNTDSSQPADFIDLDSDDDGIPDTVEGRPSASYTANDGDVRDQDLDGDGVIDLFDGNDSPTGSFGGTFTSPLDTDLDGTPDYKDTDSDDDTLLDSAEITAALSPTYHDPDGTVTTTLASLTNTDSDPSDVDFRSHNDADGDGIPNVTDPNDADACVPNTSGIPTTKDCDGDGNPVATDPDSSAPNATDDTGSAGATIDILLNDDYLPNNDPTHIGITVIAAVTTGTTCTGSPTFNSTTGSLVYASGAAETSGTCDLIYQVCNTAPVAGALPVCTTATVTITLADSDADGVPDDLDSAPSDACVPNTGGTPGTKDCDGDGNPASSDPNPASPNAANDNGSPSSPIDLLSNDDFLPNNDPSNIGSTTITGVSTGTTCAGTSGFDATTGTMTYTTAASETTGTCDVVYEVCSVPTGGGTPTCDTATATITLSDSDGDGIPDSMDSDPADACVPNVGGIPSTKDCDGDGNPASNDPDPAAPDASHDTGAAGNPVDILANDDFLPNNDPAVVGTTTLTQTGGTCSGSVSLDANTGLAVYTPGSADSGASCTVDYEVCSTSSTNVTVCEAARITFALPTTPVDSDGDGVFDSADPAPTDACVPNPAGTPTQKDCDGDGNPAISDLDPSAPDASHDNGAAGNPIDILANDDFLPNNDSNVVGTTSISQVGGSCSGSVSLNANNGMAIYTPAASDSGSSCTVDYEVCSTSPSNVVVCELATINITLPNPPTNPITPPQVDTDGDGILDSNDPAPTDACVPDPAGTPTNKDCDGDGNPAVTDPDASNPQATDDIGTPGVAVDILANDDFLPNSSPNAVGTTSLTQVGGTCTGTVVFDSNSGSATYSSDAADTNSSCTISYEVCSDSSGTAVCEVAMLTINLDPAPSGDSDGDGIPDSIEGTRDTDGDGVPNYLDLDSDNDGLLDSTEMTEDTDSDGVPDYLDLDSDNDGLTDTFEAGGTDADGNGIVDQFTDNNGDGWDDNVAASPLPGPDFDGDGYPNYLDLDSDNDGLPDLAESQTTGRDVNNDGLIDNPLDLNGDGLVDNIVANSVIDTDQDGATDHLDLDSDNDGIFDLVEAGGTDVNGDGIVDTWQDDDNDGIPNSVDVDFTGGVDADNDGIDDSADASFVSAADSDGDGIIDMFDADLQGDGFAPITNDVEDLKQVDNGDIYIGLQGKGCTIIPSKSVRTASLDPLLPLLVLLSAMWLQFKSRLKSRRASRLVASSSTAVASRSSAGIGLGVLCAATVFLSGCSSAPYGKIYTPASKRAPHDMAANPDRKFRRHIYAGTGVGASWLEPDTSEVEGVDVNDRVNAGGQVTLGADITKHLSLEMHSADLGSAGLSPTGRINYHMHGGSALIYAGKNRHNHARRGLTGYGRVGYGVLDDSPVGDVNYIENNNTHVLLGAGLEYATRRGLGLRAELISFDEDVKYAQLGLLYRMGGKHRDAPVRVAKAPPEPAPAPEPIEPVAMEELFVPPVPSIKTPDPCARFTGVLDGVNFHTDSAQLTAEAQMILDAAADELALCADTPVAINAHTDNQGSAQYNIGLSKRRAVSVAKYLAARGVNAGRISASAFGESQPVAENATDAGRARNRRVELIAR